MEGKSTQSGLDKCMITIKAWKPFKEYTPNVIISDISSTETD